MSSTHSTPQVILYRYDNSFYSVKIESILALKGISHTRVNVAPILPRPELSTLLGIQYRRIPLLAIGNDVYCDTTLIARALERMFTTENGYKSIFPPRASGGSGADVGLQEVVSSAWVDKIIFRLGTTALPWNKLPPAFVKDRSNLMGSNINPAQLEAAQPVVMNSLRLNLLPIEAQLSDSRTYLFDTATPSLSDISLHMVLAGLKPMRAARPILNANVLPKTMEWLDRVSSYLSQAEKQITINTIKGDAAADAIVGSPSTQISPSDENELKLLKLSLGALVSVAPDDTGRDFSTNGKLLLLTSSEVVLETSGTKGDVRVHFPRLGYVIRPAKAATKL